MGSVDLPDEVFLAVNPKGVLIINPESKEVLAEHPYSEVPTWGHSGSSFVLHIGNLIRQTKLYFETEQGKDQQPRAVVREPPVCGVTTRWTAGWLCFVLFLLCVSVGFCHIFFLLVSVCVCVCVFCF